MPFGSVYGAMFFGFLCGWVGLELLAQPSAGSKAAGASLALMGIALAIGLLQRRPWARWTGLAAAVLMTVLTLGSVGTQGRVIDLVVLFASLTTAVLLAVPATGRMQSPAAVPAHPGRHGPGVLGLATALGMLGLVASLWWTAGEATAKRVANHELPASAIARKVRWLDFGEGLQQAREQGQPMLVTFVTDWCPYCTKMDRKTWRAASVVERVSGLVTVKVDAEDSVDRGGFSGRELATRYRVQGFPANFLLDGQGEVIARADGYLGPGQLLSWIDRSVGRPEGSNRPASQRTSR